MIVFLEFLLQVCPFLDFILAEDTHLGAVPWPLLLTPTKTFSYPNGTQTAISLHLNAAATLSWDSSPGFSITGSLLSFLVAVGVSLKIYEISLLLENP